MNVFTKDIEGKALKACCTDTCKLVAFVCAGHMTVCKLRDFHITDVSFPTVFNDFTDEELGERLRHIRFKRQFLKTKAERLMFPYVGWILHNKKFCFLTSKEYLITEKSK